MRGLKVIKKNVNKNSRYKSEFSVNVWRQPEMGCCEGAVLRPLLYVASPARWDRPMTRSAGNAVIPHSRPGRWRFAGSWCMFAQLVGQDWSSWRQEGQCSNCVYHDHPGCWWPTVLSCCVCIRRSHSPAGRQTSCSTIVVYYTGYTSQPRFL